MSYPFNIRVYGILIDNNCVLLSDEIINGKEYTKFPGGGLEYGEGTHDCLKREFREEMNLQVEITEHFYTTDFFQASAFGNREQIISVYYLVRSLQSFDIKTCDNAVFTREQNNCNTEYFRLMQIASLSEETVTLPIDKYVVKLLKKKYSTSG